MNIRKRTWEYPKDSGKKHAAYQLDWRDGFGRHQKQFATKREAELHRDKIIRQGEAETYGLSPDPHITFKGFVEVYDAAKTWKTESYRARVLSALGLVPFSRTPLAHVGPRALLDYRELRLGTSKPSTVRQDLAALKDCFGWAKKLGYVRANPAEGIERPSLPTKQDDPQRSIPQEEFYGKLLPVAGKDGPMWRFMAWTGLRITEALAIERADVNLPKEYVMVRRGKGRKQRIIPLLPEARRAFADVPGNTMKPDKVFGYASDRHACLRRLQRRCKQAGIGPYRLHDLRHSFGSWAAESGVDLEVIAACMGHTSTTVTKQYAHLSPAYKRRELGKMVARMQQVTRKSAQRKRGAHS